MKQTDGPILNEFTVQDGKLYREQRQINAPQIFAENARLRNETQRKMDWGRFVGEIPQLVWDRWEKEHPELRLRGNDPAKLRKVRELLLLHPECLVVPKSKL